MRAARRRGEPRTIGLPIGRRIDPADVPALCERIRALLEAHDADLLVCDVSELVDPDGATVDALARMQLTARRVGCQVRLRGACVPLQELLELTGLTEIVPCEG